MWVSVLPVGPRRSASCFIDAARRTDVEHDASQQVLWCRLVRQRTGHRFTDCPRVANGAGARGALAHVDKYIDIDCIVPFVGKTLQLEVARMRGV